MAGLKQLLRDGFGSRVFRRTNLILLQGCVNPSAICAGFDFCVALSHTPAPRLIAPRGVPCFIGHAMADASQMGIVGAEGRRRLHR